MPTLPTPLLGLPPDGLPSPSVTSPTASPSPVATSDGSISSPILSCSAARRRCEPALRPRRLQSSGGPGRWLLALTRRPSPGSRIPVRSVIADLAPVTPSTGARTASRAAPSPGQPGAAGWSEGKAAPYVRHPGRAPALRESHRRHRRARPLRCRASSGERPPPSLRTRAAVRGRPAGRDSLWDERDGGRVPSMAAGPAGTRIALGAETAVVRLSWSGPRVGCLGRPASAAACVESHGRRWFVTVYDLEEFARRRGHLRPRPARRRHRRRDPGPPHRVVAGGRARLPGVTGAVAIGVPDPGRQAIVLAVTGTSRG